MKPRDLFGVRLHADVDVAARNSTAPCVAEGTATQPRRLDALQKDFSGDVKKLTAKAHEYRLRMGSLRVLFTLEEDLISVYAVRD